MKKLTTGNLYVGLMSGTSMDGVDCALVSINENEILLVDFICNEIPKNLKRELLRLTTNKLDFKTLGSCDIAIAKLFATTTLEILTKNNLKTTDITAIGSHGQTIWHQPRQIDNVCPFTIQIGDPNTISILTNITTVADFRRKDMAAGGQGAPIVPAFHREFFHSYTVNRFILNLGGISNITFLPKNKTKPSGLDTGPANVLMDAWIKKNLNREFDNKGEWANSGTFSNSLFSELMNEEYFNLPAPKSTGRELFNIGWIEAKLSKLELNIAPEDVQATLMALTVETISREIEKLSETGEILVCGGGAQNIALLDSLQIKLPSFGISSTSKLGIHPDRVEAVAFAWLASKTINHETVDFSPFTGAKHPVIAGGIYYQNNV